VESAAELYGKKDPFLTEFLSKSKNNGLSERKYVHSWVKQVKHGGLFNKLHSFEREHKQARKAWREKQLAGITEPRGGNNLYNELMRTRSRAVGASTSRAGADRIQVCLSVHAYLYDSRLYKRDPYTQEETYNADLQHCVCVRARVCSDVCMSVCMFVWMRAETLETLVYVEFLWGGYD